MPLNLETTEWRKIMRQVRGELEKFPKTTGKKREDQTAAKPTKPSTRWRQVGFKWPSAFLLIRGDYTVVIDACVGDY